jgi:hypothetical protein
VVKWINKNGEEKESQVNISVAEIEKILELEKK